MADYEVVDLCEVARFPNESEEYRRARDVLPADEIEEILDWLMT